MASKAVLANGQTLEALLDWETYRLVQQGATAAGIPMVMLNRMQPWLVAMTLAAPALRRSGFDPALGLTSTSTSGPRPRSDRFEGSRRLPTSSID